MHTVGAKDVSEERIIAAICATDRPMVTRWDIHDQMPEFPMKVVLAKLRKMVQRGRISGCTCGCRGDFELR